MANRTTVKLAPSILAADFSRLGEEVRAVVAAGADRIHVDVMDGQFVPNISLGPPVIRSLRPVTDLPLETHLMIDSPERYVRDFAEAGCDTIQVHVENAPHLHRTVEIIKAVGCRAGVVLNPATPAVAIEEILPDVDIVLVMTVNPGFGGQAFIESTLGKIRQIRKWIDQRHGECELEVDGGIDSKTAPLAVGAGARVLVAGSAVFRSPSGISPAMDAISEAAARVL